MRSQPQIHFTSPFAINGPALKICDMCRENYVKVSNISKLKWFSSGRPSCFTSEPHGNGKKIADHRSKIFLLFNVLRLSICTHVHYLYLFSQLRKLDFMLSTYHISVVMLHSSMYHVAEDSSMPIKFITSRKCTVLRYKKSDDEERLLIRHPAAFSKNWREKPRYHNTHPRPLKNLQVSWRINSVAESRGPKVSTFIS